MSKSRRSPKWESNEGSDEDHRGVLGRGSAHDDKAEYSNAAQQPHFTFEGGLTAIQHHIRPTCCGFTHQPACHWSMKEQRVGLVTQPFLT